jgi:hypothetical protein
MVIRIAELVPAAYTHDHGIAVHAAIAAALAEREAVIVSFAGVDTVTPSFVNTAFVPFLETIGFVAFKRRVRIVDATRPTIDLIEHRMNVEAKRNAAA